MGNLCPCRKNSTRAKRIVSLLLVGLDNAGKSVALRGLAGEPPESPVPTIGLSVAHLRHNGFAVKIFDLGGSSCIRDIWERYFVDVHGVIFVIDSADYARLDEARYVLDALLSHDKISGKPILVLANKQDQHDALDELDLVDKLKLEQLVNKRRCPTLVETCSATDITSRSKVDPGIVRGYNWLLGYVARNYDRLNMRVEYDVRARSQLEREERLKKLARLKYLHEAEDQRRARQGDLIESYSDYIDNHAFSDKSLDTASTATDDVSFPVPYFTDERPKSAVRSVRRHLELNGTSRRASVKSLARFTTNKTTPAILFSVPPRSAFVQRDNFFIEGRPTRSAGGASSNNHSNVRDVKRQSSLNEGGKR